MHCNYPFLTAPVSHIETTERATILPNFPNETEGESGTIYIR